MCQLPATAIGGQQGGQLPLCLGQGTLHGLRPEGVNILVRVVQHSAEVGGQVGEGVVHCRHSPPQSAGQLPCRLAHSGGGLRVDEVGHRLGLGQVQSAVEEGPAGKLTRSGLSHALGKEGLQPQGEHRR